MIDPKDMMVTLGLVLDFFGVWLLFFGDSIETGVFFDKKDKLPGLTDASANKPLKRQLRFHGAILMSIGFMLQIWSTWWKP